MDRQFTIRRIVPLNIVHPQQARRPDLPNPKNRIVAPAKCPSKLRPGQHDIRLFASRLYVVRTIELKLTFPL
jgi:hypothetical protein